jgi:uncharacterized membrane protein YjjB (DUF3815 family)
MGTGYIRRNPFSTSDENPWCATISTSVPSNRQTKQSRPSHRRTALCAIVSNTGCVSVGELEIARRISAVAVCCSSDSLSSRFRAPSSVNSRTFSMAMTA